MTDRSSAMSAKRQRDDDSIAMEKEAPPLPAIHTKVEPVGKEADKERKKPRLDTPPTIESSPADEHAVDTTESTDDNVDAEAILMRALEEAIERDAVAAKKAAVPTIVDEDDDYDESD
jgi:hypothetical protein